MGEVVTLDHQEEHGNDAGELGLIEISEGLLMDLQTDITTKNTMSLPIAELSTLGSGVSSLLPSLNTITETTTFATEFVTEIPTEGLYKLANAGAGDVLKATKDGNFWGALETLEGKSKMGQFQKAGPIKATSTATTKATTKAVPKVNPAMMMMAVTLYEIEKELASIAETTREILSFLKIEKESEIEADVQTLVSIVEKYKLNWDNEPFVSNNHKLALDIQRTARKNMNAYQKKVSDRIKAKKLIVGQSKVEEVLEDFERSFKYYKLSLYTFSLASLMEIMLSGNFKEAHISLIQDEIRKMSASYRDLFEKSSVYLESLGGAALEANLLKGIGSASEAVGKLVGRVPIGNKGPVDEFLQDKGAKLKENALEMKQEAVKEFSTMSNPGTGIFVQKMDDVIQIYNHTEEIYFDKENIYLVSG